MTYTKINPTYRTIIIYSGSLMNVNKLIIVKKIVGQLKMRERQYKITVFNKLNAEGLKIRKNVEFCIILC